MTCALACAVLSYRDEPFLLDAVRSLLAQDVPIEVVVVNSGGGDPASRIAAAGLDVPVYSVAHRLYPGAARNIGIECTRAPYVAFLAADCLATPGWGTNRIRAHRGGAEAVASPMTTADPSSSVAWAALLLQHNRRLAVTAAKHRLHYSLSYDRALFERFGRFREDLRAGEDTEFNARFSGRARTVLAPDVLTAHRYPTELSAMLRDAFRRGALQSRMQGQIGTTRPQRIRVAFAGPRNVIRSVIVTARSSSPERGMMLRALPLVVAGAAAHFAGALIAPARSAIP
ncbi:MAG: glycosyltransferase [Gemmatimonadetes bacterium]|nr:glycosyltransferase [Gemmatimonadota bacterium]